MVQYINIFKFRRYRHVLFLVLLLFISLSQFACAEEDPSNLVPYVTGLSLEQEEGSDLILHVEGELPYKCAKFQEIKQEVQGRMITITMKAVVPEGESCKRSLTEFSEQVEIDISGLESGQYTIDVHNILADVEIP